MAYLSILGTVLLTVYGQIIFKWRMSTFGQLPADNAKKLVFLLNAILDPFIISGFFSAFIASLLWMAVVTKFDLSYAYPFTSLSFVLVLILSAIFFNEAINLYKVLGIGFIVLGVFFISRSMT